MAYPCRCVTVPLETVDEFLDRLEEELAFNAFVLDGGDPEEIEAIEEVFGVTWDEELSVA